MPVLGLCRAAGRVIVTLVCFPVVCGVAAIVTAQALLCWWWSRYRRSVVRTCAALGQQIVGPRIRGSPLGGSGRRRMT
jgi:hypothetical protein